MFGMPVPNFGAPVPLSGMGGESPSSLPEQPISLPMPQIQPRGGMFGGKFGVGQAIVAALNGYLASRGNPVGMANMQMMQQAAQQRRENAEYDRRQQVELQRQKDLYQFQQGVKTPEYGEFEKALIASGVQPGTPEWAKYMTTRRDNMLDPVVMTPQGPMTRSQLLGGQGGQPAPQGITFTPIGGAGGDASGNFQH